MATSDRRLAPPGLGRGAALLALAIAGCGSDAPSAPPVTTPAALMDTLVALADFGNKRVGTEAGARAADYIKARFEAAGLQDIRFESFQFPRHDVDSKSMTVSIDRGVATPMVIDVLEASSPGHADAEVRWVNQATAADLEGIDLTGKIALVVRSTSFHRSTQYRNLVAGGAVAMLYVSAAPDNLIQVGSVKRSWEAFGDIPAVTIGAADGQRLRDALDGGQIVRATIDVQAHSTPATGRNVVGVIPGDSPEQIVIGAHYDSWFAGSADNGSGVATLLAIVDRRAQQPRPARTLVFVAYDGEEVALYGGYKFWRTHVVENGAPVVSVLNFEMPASREASVIGLAHSAQSGLDGALVGARLRDFYGLYTVMDFVPGLFGGIIPTDIQGIYRAGVPTASTASDSPWYHTVQDTPDKVDIVGLAGASDAFDVAIDLLCAASAASLAERDPALWRASTVIAPRAATAPVVVDVTITDAGDAPQAGAVVQAALLADDFFLVGETSATTDAAGKVRLTLPPTARPAWVHVTSGPTWPLVEAAVPLAAAQ